MGVCLCLLGFPVCVSLNIPFQFEQFYPYTFAHLIYCCSYTLYICSLHLLLLLYIFSLNLSSIDSFCDTDHATDNHF